MTNLEGLWILFAALILFGVCVVAAAVLGTMLVRERWSGDKPGDGPLRVQTAVAMLAVGGSTVAWAFAFVFMTPTGIVERLFRPNPILVMLLLGYTAPAILGGYVLWRRGTGSATYQTI